MRNLLLALVLGCSGSAYAAAGMSPPVDTPVTIPSSNGTACAIGPSYTGQIPAAAAAAGFTTCAANYDFTNTSNFTNNGNPYNFSQINTWLDCAGATNPLWYYGASSNVAPCGDASIANDSGTNALQLTLTPSDMAAGHNLFSILTAVIHSGNGTTTPATGTTFPEQYYAESKIRMVTPDSNMSGSGHLLTDFWMNSATGNSPYMEFDIIEQYSVTGDAGGTNEGLSFFPESHSANSSVIPGYNHNQYHVFGERVTMRLIWKHVDMFLCGWRAATRQCGERMDKHGQLRNGKLAEQRRSTGAPRGHPMAGTK